MIRQQPSETIKQQILRQILHLQPKKILGNCDSKLIIINHLVKRNIVFIIKDNVLSEMVDRIFNYDKTTNKTS